MGKTTYRLVPFETYEVENLESWLSSLSGCGLYPVRVYSSPLLVKCEKANRAPAKYAWSLQAGTKTKYPTRCANYTRPQAGNISAPLAGCSTRSAHLKAPRRNRIPTLTCMRRSSGAARAAPSVNLY